MNNNKEFDILDKQTRNDIFREKFNIKDAADHFIQAEEQRCVADERKRVDLDAILQRTELKRAAILLKKSKSK